MCRSEVAKTITGGVILFSIIWIVLVFVSSIIKASPLNDWCDVSVPYDHIIYDRLFCEIK